MELRPISYLSRVPQLSAGFYAHHHPTSGALTGVFPTKTGLFEEKNIALPAGTVYAIEGEVVFQLTEKGWRYDSWRHKRLGYCTTAKSARECYQALKWES